MYSYEEKSVLFKALADPTRLEIIDLISCGELCACKILERFNFTQPTLSHHMKILCGSGLVTGRKEGKWTYYTLVDSSVQDFRTFLTEVTSCKENCICREISCCEEDCE